MLVPASTNAPRPQARCCWGLDWAGICLALGGAFETRAAAARVFLLRSGERDATVITVSVAGGFTLGSRIFFRG